LLPAGDIAIESEEIARAYEAAGGNIRETPIVDGVLIHRQMTPVGDDE
jgi:hypothetical protein